jgi:hypothetical protein
MVRETTDAPALVPADSLERLFSSNECLLWPTHPDIARYEYLYMNGAFVSPYKAFPQGVERGRWQCYDGKTGETLNCTFVRAGFEHFQYIFRERG